MEAFFVMDFTTKEGVLKDTPPSIWGQETRLHQGHFEHMREVISNNPISTMDVYPLHHQI
jgi:hypothetical protein